MPRPRLLFTVALLAFAATAAAVKPVGENPDWAVAPQEKVLAAAVRLTIQDTLPSDVLLRRAEAARDAVRKGDSVRRSAVESILCRAQYRRHERNAAAEACDWAVALARSSGNPLALSVALRMSALVAIDREDPAKAMTLLREGRNAAEAAGNAAMQAVTLNTLGIASESSGFDEDATRYYAEAFRFATQANEPGVAVLAATNLGMLHVANRQPAAALRRAQAGLPLAGAAGNPQIAFVLQAVEAESLVMLGRVDEAMVLLDHVMPAAQHADDRVLGHLYMALAQAQLAKQQVKPAVESARKAVEMVHNSAVRRAFAELTLADALVADGQVDAGLERLRNLDAKTTSLAGARADALARTGELLLQRGKTAEGARFLHEALQARSQLESTRAREQLAYLNSQLEADRRDHEIARLKAQQAAAKAETARADVQRNAAIVVALLGVLAAAGWWRLRRLERQRTRLAGAIVSHREALEASTSRAEALSRELDHKRRLEALGRLTAGAADDLKTLLAAVQSALAQAQARPAVAADAATRVLLEQAAVSARTGEQLAGQLQAFGRRQNLQPERIAFAVFVESHLALLEKAAGARARLAFQTAPEVPAMLVDPSGLAAALVNLVSNARMALPATPGDHVIRVHARPETLGEADPRAPLLPAGPYVAIAVEDDGCGMTPQVLERATEPFFTTRAPGEGSGLGLNMVQAFARQAGGELHLQSAPGHGTTATLLLPAAV